LPEAALLVGLLPSPTGYDPCFDAQAALDARNRVLGKMVDTGRISADAGRRARRSPVRLSPEACRDQQRRRGAPFYTDQVRRDLQSQVGADVAAEGNFLVDTHLDPALQATVERVLRQRISSSANLGVSEGAVVVLDARNGGILAVAGGRDYSQSQFNRATMAQRQPGSTFKLFPYLAALERGTKVTDPVACGPLRWRGQTFSSDCGGTISVVSAFARSSNTAALRQAQRVGLDAVVQQARDLGITSPLAAVPGLALGQSEVTLLELTAAYAAVANGGTWYAPSTIRQVVDGETCQEDDRARCRKSTGPSATTAPGRRVMQQATAKSMQELLRSVVRAGTGQAASTAGSGWGALPPSRFTPWQEAQAFWYWARPVRTSAS
jgi:membrane peptidoglycan carboxypeptidase